AVRRLLEAAMSAGHTVIVTNAMDGWVQTSARRWIPGVLPLLRKVPVVSTRTERGVPRYSGKPDLWKVQAFKEVLQGLDHKNSVKNLIAMGDSDFEIIAAHAMSKELGQAAAIKTVKLKAAPTAQELRKELDLMVEQFDQILESTHDFKIDFTTVNNKNNKNNNNKSTSLL
ncbi:unnamed protein product, partial [Polarella glacialis]